MIRQSSYNDIIWYDLESPQPEEIAKLAAAYHLDILVQQELLTPTMKPKADRYENCLYVILHFPALRPGLRDINQEIDFVIGQNFIITTHYDNIDPLHYFGGNIFGSRIFLTAKNKKIHGGHIFFQMVISLYYSMMKELEALESVLGKAEKRLFAGQEKNMLIALSKMNRDLLDFKSSTNLHKSVLESFGNESMAFFGKEFENYPKEIMNEYYKVHGSIQENKDFLEELRRTNDSLLTNKQNEIMKTLTIMAFITVPLTLVASIFGMNAENLPIVGMPNGFWLIIGMMASLALCFFIFFKFKKWL